MALQKQRNIYLSTCLLESIEDENYRFDIQFHKKKLNIVWIIIQIHFSNTRKLLVEHHADPNLLIPESNIAPIHYAAGMENTNFAEAAMKLILKYKGKFFTMASIFKYFNLLPVFLFLKEIQMFKQLMVKHHCT